MSHHFPAARHRILFASVLVGGVLATACGTTGGDPTSVDAEGPCRAPLADDAPDPIGAADGPHPALSGEDWWRPVGEATRNELADETAGMWLDQQDGEVVVMVTAEDQRTVLDELRSLVDDDHAERVTCMTAEHTMAHLASLQRQAMDRLTEVGAPASGGIDTVGNRVEVHVESDLDAAREMLGELADDPALVVDRPSCAEVADIPEDGIALPGGGSTCQGMDALTGGVLRGEIDVPEGEACLWFADPSGNRTAVVWPRGWWVSPDGVVHDHRGEPRAEVGEEVRAGGGSGAHARDALPESCQVSGEVWILNSLDPA